MQLIKQRVHLQGSQKAQEPYPTYPLTPFGLKKSPASPSRCAHMSLGSALMPAQVQTPCFVFFSFFETLSNLSEHPNTPHNQACSETHFAMFNIKILDTSLHYHQKQKSKSTKPSKPPYFSSQGTDQLGPPGDLLRCILRRLSRHLRRCLGHFLGRRLGIRSLDIEMLCPL